MQRGRLQVRAYILLFFLAPRNPTMANNDRRTFNVARNKPAPVTQEQPALDDTLIS